MVIFATSYQVRASKLELHKRKCQLTCFCSRLFWLTRLGLSIGAWFHCFLPPYFRIRERRGWIIEIVHLLTLLNLPQIQEEEEGENEGSVFT